MLQARKPKNTAQKGKISESIILARLILLGYNCLVPWGNDCRYDIGIDDDGKLVRVQCKTARYGESLSDTCRGCFGVF